MMSWVAVDRIVEQKIGSDESYRRQMGGRPRRSLARHLTDGELLSKLRTFGIDIDRPTLERLCDAALSAEEVARPLIERCGFRTDIEAMEGDWIWVCLTALWPRWFPDRPSFESLDDKMQAGYELLAAGDEVAACRAWLNAWEDLLRILDKAGIGSIEEFDERFGGTQSLYNWSQDLEVELWNAGLDDRSFLLARVAVCEEALRRFPTADQLMAENRRRHLAESHYELGETEKAEMLYRTWLEADPRWGWGWIGWSDCYRATRTELRDLERAERILEDALGIAELRDRGRVLGRLADVYAERGRADAATKLRRQQREEESRRDTTVVRRRRTITFEGEGVPLEQLPDIVAGMRVPHAGSRPATTRVGRNEPCPCGSGRKFKRCCGA